MDETPPERTLVVIVLLGRELNTKEHAVSRNEVVTRQGEISADALW